MPKTSPYLEFAVEQLASLGQISSRFMIGGWVLYCDGVIFALIAGNALYLKADDANRPQFEQKGLPAFKPFPERDAVMKYYLAPPELFEDLDVMRRWAGGAIDAGRRAATKKKPKKGARS